MGYGVALMSNKTYAIVAACILSLSFMTPAFGFDVDSINMTLQDAQVTEFQNYDILTAIFSIFNGGTQQAKFSGHTMLYLNDTNGDYWEYSSHIDLEGFSETDCPVLDTTINPGNSTSIKLCYLILNDNSTGYSLIVNDNPNLMDMNIKEFVLESVPDWFKTTAGDWCADTITESDFTNSTQSYIQNGTINVLKGQSGTDIGTQTPSWVKNNACLWSGSQISDYEFLDGIYWLIDNGKIQL